LAAAFLSFLLFPVAIGLAMGNESSRSPLDMVGAVDAQARAAFAGSARFFNDLRLLYQVAELRNGLETQRAVVRHSSGGQRPTARPGPRESTSRSAAADSEQATATIEKCSSKSPAAPTLEKAQL